MQPHWRLWESKDSNTFANCSISWLPYSGLTLLYISWGFLLSALAARLIPIIFKNCRKKLYLIQNRKAWIPAFAGMTRSGNQQSINRIGISISLVRFGRETTRSCHSTKLPSNSGAAGWNIAVRCKPCPSFLGKVCTAGCVFLRSVRRWFIRRRDRFKEFALTRRHLIWYK